MKWRPVCLRLFFFFFFNDTAPTEIYTLSLHDALPIASIARSFVQASRLPTPMVTKRGSPRSEEHTSELQSLRHLVCRLLLAKKKNSGVTSPNRWVIEPGMITVATSYFWYFSYESSLAAGGSRSI